DSRLLEQGVVRELPPQDGTPGKALVGCGRIALEQEVVIVDPTTGVLCPNGTIGEIWLSGKNIAAGYWRQQSPGKSAFGAKVNGRDSFLRTGDLGFLYDGELFISGRIKDVIILKGRNIHPQDVEQVICQSHPAFCQDGTAAFSVELDGSDRLVVMQEMKRTFRKSVDYDQLIATARQAISRHFEVMLFDAIFIPEMTIPKTSSGKIRRSFCRDQYLANDRERLVVEEAVFSI